MASGVERTPAQTGTGAWTHPVARLAYLPLTPLSIGAAAVGAVDGWDGGLASRLAWVGLTLAWATAGTALLLRGSQRLGLLALWFALLAGVVALAAAIARDRPGDDVPALVRALAVAFLPAAAMHILLALPSGALGTRVRAATAAAGYAAAAGVGVLLWRDQPSYPAWPVALEAAVFAGVGINRAASRYRLARPGERRQMHWLALAIAVATEIVLVGIALRALVGWPPQVLQVAAVATIPIALAFLLGTSKRLQAFVDRILVHAISLAGLTALVAGVYLLVVLGLGRAPTHAQRTLLVLTMAAAAISALLYVPARLRLADFSNRLVHGARQAPDELVRNFGARLSRAVPLEELLLQLAESLRGALSIEAAEVWTGTGGLIERVVSEPERGPAALRLSASEQSVVARSGVSGPARIAVWLPQLLADRGDADLRVAPISHAGELFGLIVVERSADGDPFDEDAEKVLAELARQVGLVLRNVRLDSALQASLDELRRNADELRASRARVVAAADAERRRIERDLHDGAQQYLVGVSVNIGAASELMESDPQRAKMILDELQGSVQEAMQDFRDLAQGIYPPLLQDRGLAEALANAARRAPLPARVEATVSRRYQPDIEAAVYFCCLEALQNAAKHGGDGVRATVRVWEEADGLLFEVRDDGSGLDPARGGLGAGLTNMRDRLDAIGGGLRIESALGHGTRLVGTIPLNS